MSLTSAIAKIGTNPTFIAQNAHCWFAFSVLVTLHLGFIDSSIWLFIAPLLGFAALKEFWFDATYEMPKQTFEDNMLDFGGYALGLSLGEWVCRWLA